MRCAGTGRSTAAEVSLPRAGRPAPFDIAANDLAHWHTQLTVGDPAVAAARLCQGRARFVSSGVVRLADRALGFGVGFLPEEMKQRLRRFLLDRLARPPR